MVVALGASPATRRMPNLIQNAKAGVYFARSLYNYKRGRAKPLSAVFVVCNRCNLRCKYCNSPFLKERELSLSEIDTLFTNLQHTGIFRLGLTGGEPLVREDIQEIVKLAIQKKFYLSMNSNLLLYHERPHVFDEVKFIFTSLDGPPQVHEKNRGKASQEGVVDAIIDLRRRKKPVVAICVVDQQDFTDIEYLIDLAERHDFKLHFQLRGSMPEVSTKKVLRGQLAPQTDNDAYRDVWRKLYMLKKRTKSIVNSKNYFEKILHWSDYHQFAQKTQNKSCAAGYGYIYIASNGLGYPCCLIKDTTQGIDLLTQNWIEKFHDKKPCNDCISGPYLEFNLLYKNPLASIVDLMAGYGRG
ncbi:MAG: Coenzyme PQQ synthesis protein E [Turneriella sp.]|nr:Coenzyme PQQ synthesis protein E [Turneriella sp.]